MKRLRTASAFTLVEVLVSVAVLVLMVTIVAELMTRTQDTIIRANAHVREFQEARRVLDNLSSTLSQATMDSVWAYQNSPTDTSSVTGYARVADHHFILAPSVDLLPAKLDPEAGQAVFFQAPLGKAQDIGKRRLHDLVNCCGYYVQYGSDLPERPEFLTSSESKGLSPERKRFRLMRYLQPAEKSLLYGDSAKLGLNQISDRAKALKWFQGDIETFSVPLADNILALVLTPYVKTKSGGDTVVNPDSEYNYDSRDFQWNGMNAISQNRRHQLPVKIGITLIAADERSYEKLILKVGEEAATKAVREVLKDKFTDHSKLSADLEAVETGLSALPLHHKVFASMVALRNSN